MFAVPLPLPQTLVVPSRSANKRTHAAFKHNHFSPTTMQQRALAQM
jgi:hypothetical protein